MHLYGIVSPTAAQIQHRRMKLKHLAVAVAVAVVGVALCAMVLLGATCASAADSEYGIFMPSYSDAKTMIDQAVAKSFGDKLIKGPLPYEVRSVVQQIRLITPLAEVRIINDASINACSSPSYIYLNAGLIIAADNKAELAVPILHEQGHIYNEDIGARYEQIKKVYDSFARSTAQRGEKPGDKETMKLISRILPQIVGIFSKGQEFGADEFAWNWLPKAGYPDEAMIAFFEKLGGRNKPGVIEKIFSDHPPLFERIEKLRTYTVGIVVPPLLKFSPAIVEIDPDKFLPAFSDKKVEGYAYMDLTPSKSKGILLFLNNEKKVGIKKKGFLDFLLGGSGPEDIGEPPAIQLGRATEMVVVIKNLTKDRRHIVSLIAVGEEDQRMGGFPGRPDSMLLEPKTEHGDWPYNEYVAFMVKLPEIKGKKDRLVIITSIFSRVGDEAFQISEKPTKIVGYPLSYPLQ